MHDVALENEHEHHGRQEAEQTDRHHEREEHEIVRYEPGENHGQRTTRLYGPNAARIAGDTTPWSNPPWNGDEHAWRLEIDNRARNLNEYKRTR